MTARDVLNRIKWKDDGLAHVEIWYTHRGAPKDTMIISGEIIIDLGRSFFNTGEASIPYHRIQKIVYKDEIIFQRTD